MSTYYRLAVFIPIFCGCLLFLASYSKKPISYLHSWNQITTLSHIREISNMGFTMWNKPVDVVTRLSAHPDEKKISLEPPYSDFRIFEEFPMYHILAASISHTGISLENASKLISIFFYVFGSYGLYYICLSAFNKNNAILTLILWSTSFPVLYYGQSIMSDTAMTAFAIWSFYFLIKYQKDNSTRILIAGLSCLIISSLFKSYGLVLAIPWFMHFYKSKKIISGLTLLALSGIPVVSWHVWTLFQEGHQEIISHGILEKLKFILSIEFLFIFQKYIFRYLGFLPGAIFFLSIVLYFTSSIRSFFNDKSRTINLLKLWIFPTIVYLVFTADKLSHHDYYFLLLSPGLFVITAITIQFVTHYLQEKELLKGKNKVYLVTLAIIIISPSVQSFLSLHKALKENSDVTQCSENIRVHTEEKSLIAYASDVSRYNSLAYYSERRGLILEQMNFPLERYVPYGVTHIAVNLPETEFNDYKYWIEKQAFPKLRQISLKTDLIDFKNRKRSCGLWKVNQ